jgi:acyl-CoA thioester hydrolase
MIKAGLGSVQSWECDVNGHLNLRYYAAHATDSLASLAVALGLGARAAASRNARFTILRHHMRFLREMRAGTPFAFTGGVVESTGETLRLYQQMTDASTDEVSATFITDAALLDQATRAPQRLGDQTCERAANLRVDVPSYGAPKGLALDAVRAAPTWDEADRLGLRLSGQGIVLSRECDGSGLMTQGAYMARFVDAIPHLTAHIPGLRGDADVKIGTVALEARVIYRDAPREGDVLALRSGLKTLAGKTATRVHWLFNLETGEAVATGEILSIFLDLRTRRAVEPAAEQRHEMEKQLLPGLSA